MPDVELNSSDDVIVIRVSQAKFPQKDGLCQGLVAVRLTAHLTNKGLGCHRYCVSPLVTRRKTSSRPSSSSHKPVNLTPPRFTRNPQAKAQQPLPGMCGKPRAPCQKRTTSKL